ncbi:MAG: hypothetical protein PHE83_01480 [Opitutaceae bacterium]|nr:hypothetical protein [Opitutaceae bacterium]
MKKLEDGGCALGLFNRADTPQTEVFTHLGRIGLIGAQHVRDLWRQQDLADVKEKIEVTVPPHGVVLHKFTAVE